MKYNPDIHHRRSVRLRDFDYSAGGAYFVTICTQGRECLLGEISSGEMRLNEAGSMVQHWWAKITDKFPGIALDEYSIMPNHFHGIVCIVGADPCVCPPLTVGVGGHMEGAHTGAGTCKNEGAHMGAGTCKNEGAHMGAGICKNEGAHMGAPLHRMVQWFKTMTTNAYISGVKEHNWPPFPGRLWQRNYYERVIRDEKELTNIREYIAANPFKWAEDKENPDVMQGRTHVFAQVQVLMTYHDIDNQVDTGLRFPEPVADGYSRCPERGEVVRLEEGEDA